MEVFHAEINLEMSRLLLNSSLYYRTSQSLWEETVPLWYRVHINPHTYFTLEQFVMAHLGTPDGKYTTLDRQRSLVIFERQHQDIIPQKYPFPVGLEALAFFFMTA